MACRGFGRRAAGRRGAGDPPPAPARTGGLSEPQGQATPRVAGGGVQTPRGVDWARLSFISASARASGGSAARHGPPRRRRSAARRCLRPSPPPAARPWGSGWASSAATRLARSASAGESASSAFAAAGFPPPPGRAGARPRRAPRRAFERASGARSGAASGPSPAAALGGLFRPVAGSALSAPIAFARAMICAFTSGFWPLRL